MTFRVKHIGLSSIQWDDCDPMPVPKGCERRETCQTKATERDPLAEYRAALDRLNRMSKREWGDYLSRCLLGARA